MSAGSSAELTGSRACAGQLHGTGWFGADCDYTESMGLDLPAAGDYSLSEKPTWFRILLLENL